MDIRVGYGYDVHQLVVGRRLVVGGVEIPYEWGLLGHSDADVLLHAITDAMLGALALGDIGTHFPDSDPENKNIDSRILLRKTIAMVQEKGYRLMNIDATVIAEKPKLAPYIFQMRQRIATDISTDISRISVKATTSEKMGFVGRLEGIGAHATVLVLKY